MDSEFEKLKNDSRWDKLSEFDPFPNEQAPVAPMQNNVTTPAVETTYQVQARMQQPTQPEPTPSPINYEKQMHTSKTIAIITSILAAVGLCAGVGGVLFAIVNNNKIAELSQKNAEQAEIISAVGDAMNTTINTIDDLPTLAPTTGYIYISDAFANNLEEEVSNLERNVNLLYEINMGGTAIGTGLNARAGYAELCIKKMRELTGEPFVLASDLVEATPDTGAYVSYSAALKRLAVKLSKICNDLRLMASGPRCGLHEINLPPMAPGSSIMPGKVNPVIPEVTNQVCFKVIGNDTTVTYAAEAGQLQLNVMEPIITECIFESITWLCNVMAILREKCIDGITINREHNLETVKHSIGIVTALNPIIGYKASTKIAKEALETGKSVYNLVLEHGLMTKEQLDKILNPANMLTAH